MKKILFLHGFFASGSCQMALALKEALASEAQVLTPDLDLHPRKAMQMIRNIIEKEKPIMLVGNSCGAFLSQMLAAESNIPALLGNPHFKMTDFLRERIGPQQYKAPRRDSRQNFVINESLIEEFSQLEKDQWKYYDPHQKEIIWGIFGTNDSLAHFESLFLKYYSHAFHFPGGHTPNEQEVKTWYVPLIREMIHVFYGTTQVKSI